MDNDVVYIYTKMDEVGDYYDVPDIIGIWDNQQDLMNFINQDRKSKWEHKVNNQTFGRDRLTNPSYDYDIYDDYDPELFITAMVKNKGHWIDADDLVCHSQQEGKWTTLSQEQYFEYNNQELWKPDWQSLKAIDSEIETKKKKNMDQEDRTRFTNLYKKFKQQGVIDGIISEIDGK